MILTGFLLCLDARFECGHGGIKCRGGLQRASRIRGVAQFPIKGNRVGLADPGDGGGDEDVKQGKRVVCNLYGKRLPGVDEWPRCLRMSFLDQKFGVGDRSPREVPVFAEVREQCAGRHTQLRDLFDKTLRRIHDR